MEYLGYDVTPRINFSIKEIDAMYSNDALNGMLLKHTEGDKEGMSNISFKMIKNHLLLIRNI